MFSFSQYDLFFLLQSFQIAVPLDVVVLHRVHVSYYYYTSYIRTTIQHDIMWNELPTVAFTFFGIVFINPLLLFNTTQLRRSFFLPSVRLQIIKTYIRPRADRCTTLRACNVQTRFSRSPNRSEDQNKKKKKKQSRQLTNPFPLASHSNALPSFLVGLDMYKKNVSAHRWALQMPLMYLRTFSLSAGSTLRMLAAEYSTPSVGEKWKKKMKKMYSSKGGERPLGVAFDQHASPAVHY